MRRIALILLPLVVGLLGCKRPEVNDPNPRPVLPVTSVAASSPPEWIDNVPPNSDLGSSSPNGMGDVDFQRTVATARARTRMARDLDAHMQALYHDLVQESQVLAEKLQSSTAQEVKENISRQLTDITLRGTQARRFWTDPRTGTIWVLVVSDPTLLQASVRESFRQGLMELGLGQGALQEAEGRMDELFGRKKAPR